MYYSFVMLKPDALDRCLVAPIMEALLKKADVQVEVLDCRVVHTKLLFKHYAEVIEKLGPKFQRQCADYFTNKWVLPMIVKSEQADMIERIRKVVGATDPSKAAPGTIRGDFGEDSYEKCGAEDRCCHNLIHASDCPEAARREIALWFGEKAAAQYFDCV